MDTQENRDSDSVPDSDSGSRVDSSPPSDGAVHGSDTSTESAPPDTDTIPQDTFANDPNCVHPEVVESCSDGWCRIPAGCFTAGSPVDEMGHGAASEIQNQVTLTRAFEIQQFELTQGQWTDAGFPNPSGFGPNGTTQCASPDCPVENINWYEAVAFANRLSEIHNPPIPACYTLTNCNGEVGQGMVCESVAINATTIYECKGYRLPTMYEAEYAYRAGTRTAFYSGDITNYSVFTECEPDGNLDNIAWYCRNSEDRTHPVGQKEPNGWGLFDVAGNVFEWVDTQFNGRSTGPAPVTDPIGPTDVPNRRTLRGGAINATATTCRAARNLELPPALFAETSGTRIARTL